MHFEKKILLVLCVGMCTHVDNSGCHALECGGYRKLLGGFLCHFVLSWRFGPRLTSHWILSITCPAIARVTALPGFYVNDGDSNSGPQTWTANTH